MRLYVLPPLSPPESFFHRIAFFLRGRGGDGPASPAVHKKPSSFLIFRLDSLGDLVMTTPLFRALKAAHPRSRCTVVVQRSYRSLLATNPHIDEILTLPNIRPGCLPTRLKRLLAACLFYWTQLRKRHFDVAISPRWDVDEHMATLLCALSRAATRIGYSEAATPAKQRMNRGFDRAFTVCLPPGPVQHEVLRNLAVAEGLGVSAPDCQPEIFLTQQDRMRAARLLHSVSASIPLIAIGIGAQSPGRRWPLSRYAGVLAELGPSQLVRPVIVCSGPELGEALKLAGLILHAPIIISGEMLRTVCAVLERCELFIGNDSGAAHLAAAMGCKTIVISRHPRNGDPNHFNSPVRFAPWGREVRVLQPATGLPGCDNACLSLKPHCIEQISVDEVVAAARDMASSAQPHQAPVLVLEPRASDRPLDLQPLEVVAREASHRMTSTPVV